MIPVFLGISMSHNFRWRVLSTIVARRAKGPVDGLFGRLSWWREQSACKTAMWDLPQYVAGLDAENRASSEPDCEVNLIAWEPPAKEFLPQRKLSRDFLYASGMPIKATTSFTSRWFFSRLMTSPHNVMLWSSTTSKKADGI